MQGDGGIGIECMRSQSAQADGSVTHGDGP
jgi:hypothetical protein